MVAMTQPSEVTLYENEIRYLRLRNAEGTRLIRYGERLHVVIKAPDSVIATLPSPQGDDGVLGVSIKFDKVGTWLLQVHLSHLIVGTETMKTPVTKVNVVGLPDGRSIFPPAGHGYGPRRIR